MEQTEGLMSDKWNRAQALIDLVVDIGNWVKRERVADVGVPGFWDELCTSERLTEYLVSLGYRKTHILELEDPMQFLVNSSANLKSPWRPKNVGENG
jgi:hypothetical protein